jgi:hypothetical protein
MLFKVKSPNEKTAIPSILIKSFAETSLLMTDNTMTAALMARPTAANTRLIKFKLEGGKYDKLPANHKARKNNPVIWYVT